MCHGFNTLEMHVIIVTCGGKKSLILRVFSFVYISPTCWTRIVQRKAQTQRPCSPKFHLHFAVSGFLKKIQE